MKDLIIIAVVAVIAGFSVWYVYKSKKNGKKCIGCPYGDCCGKPGEKNCGCSDNKTK